MNGAGPAISVRIARSPEWAEALGLAFRDEPPTEQQARVANALPMLRTGELDPEGLLVACDGRRLLGAMVCLPTAGAGALAWPPGVAPGPDQSRVQDVLVAAALDWLRRRGAKLAQVLLGSHETDRGTSLTRGGFRRVTRLWYLRHDLTTSVDGDGLPRIRLEPVTPTNSGPFCDTLLRTYEASDDCPEVNGVRTVDESLAAHRAQGRADPPLWWLAHTDSGPAGVLLLASELGETGWEIAYLGVVPEKRGKGVGSALVAAALESARVGTARQLNLSVDARNRPAWGLYRKCGFRPYSERDVYLAVLSPKIRSVAGG